MKICAECKHSKKHHVPDSEVAYAFTYFSCERNVEPEREPSTVDLVTGKPTPPPYPAEGPECRRERFGGPIVCRVRFLCGEEGRFFELSSAKEPTE